MQATSENIPDLLSLEKQIYSGRTPWDVISFKSEIGKKTNSLYLVVYQAATLVAFIGAHFYSREVHITNIAVAPAFQKSELVHIY